MRKKVDASTTLLATSCRVVLRNTGATGATHLSRAKYRNTSCLSFHCDVTYIKLLPSLEIFSSLEALLKLKKEPEAHGT